MILEIISYLVEIALMIPNVFQVPATREVTVLDHHLMNPAVTLLNV